MVIAGTPSNKRTSSKQIDYDGHQACHCYPDRIVDILVPIIDQHGRGTQLCREDNEPIVAVAISALWVKSEAENTDR